MLLPLYLWLILEAFQQLVLLWDTYEKYEGDLLRKIIFAWTKNHIYFIICPISKRIRLGRDSNPGHKRAATFCVDRLVCWTTTLPRLADTIILQVIKAFVIYSQMRLFAHSYE